ncbi:integral membrane protein [Diplocarpon rosae]|nr:integral membrane protein [Diplocarpon rosae]
MYLRRLLPLLSLVATALAAANFSYTDLLQHLPECAIGCIISKVPADPVMMADPSLSCRNDTLQASVASCILNRCDFQEQSLVISLNSKLCEGIPPESRATEVAIVGIVCGSIALVAVALRCYSRISIVRRLGNDDWLAVAAGSILIPLVALDVYNGLVNGYGRHFWDIDPSRVAELLKIFWVAEILCILALSLVKASVLVFYLRVFTARWFVVADILTLCAVVLAGLALLTAIVFQCTPISGIWDRTLSSQCINVNTLSYASGAISVALDLIILILPVPAILGLPLGLKKKTSLILMFALGSLACVTSGIRLKYLVDFAISKDPSYLPLTGDNALPAIWSFVEISVALTCACLPAIRALLSRWFPTIFDLASPSSPHPQCAMCPKVKTFDESFTRKPSNRSRPAQKIGPSYNKRAVSILDDDQLIYIPSSEVLPNNLAKRFHSQFRQGRRASGLYSQHFPQAVHNDLRSSRTHSGSSATLPPHLGQLDSAPRSRPGSAEVKIWINPTFDRKGNLVEYGNRRRAPVSQQASLHHISAISIPSSDHSIWVLEGPRISDEYVDTDHAIAVERRVSHGLHMLEEASRRQSHNVQYAEEGVVMRPVGVALPRKKYRSGRTVMRAHTASGSVQSLLSPIFQDPGSSYDELHLF